MELCVALIDHGSEINIISSDFYNRERWPIDRNHGWKVRVAIEFVEDLCGACPNIKSYNWGRVSKSELLRPEEVVLSSNLGAVVHHNIRDGD